MKKYCQELKTSDKITFLFTAFNFLSLIILLFSINIIYFFSWYSDQKAESMYDINTNYNIYISNKNEKSLKEFKKYVLKRNAVIIPQDWWELICSSWVGTKIHSEIKKIKDKLFYSNGSKTFFVFTNYYEDVWDIKIFLDTTLYVKSQILIIKISLFIIFISLLLYFLVWRKISKFALRDLKSIADKAKNIDIEKDFEKIDILCNKDDEINILARTLNKSFLHIKNQTSILKQFITDVSHEFKTPLMIINSQIDLYNKKLEKSKLSKWDTSKLLLNIKEKTYKMNSLLETFIMLSKIENKIITLDKKEVVFQDYIRELINNFILNYDKKINIKYNLLSALYVQIEESTFNILFENLLSNAIKFSGKNIEIEIWSNENSFWIKNNWVWIEKDKLNKVFTKFYRHDTNKEWFWVGLFIVKRLVDLYFWHIEVKSELWKETTFIIKI